MLPRCLPSVQVHFPNQPANPEGQRQNHFPWPSPDTCSLESIPYPSSPSISAPRSLNKISQPSAHPSTFTLFSPHTAKNYNSRHVPRGVTWHAPLAPTVMWPQKDGGLVSGAFRGAPEPAEGIWQGWGCVRRLPYTLRLCTKPALGINRLCLGALLPQVLVCVTLRKSLSLSEFLNRSNKINHFLILRWKLKIGNRCEFTEELVTTSSFPGWSIRVAISSPFPPGPSLALSEILFLG